MKLKVKHVAIVFLMFLISILVVNSNSISKYIDSLRFATSASIVAIKKLDEKLYKQIVEKAKDYEVEPQNAKIDRVWKAIPGYNGLTVDINKSYENMVKDKQFSADKLVFKQRKPEITLDDLKPAPIFRGHEEKQSVSFLINVAWGNEYIPTMLETLKKNNVKATFFLEGRWVKENPQLAKMIVDAGHEVGNHSYTHADFKKITVEKMNDEIIKTNEIIKVTTGATCKFFAPPSGSFRDETVQVAANNNLKTIMWTVDTIDWQKPPVSVLINRVMSKVHPGALILMHPTEPTDKSLNELIRQIKEKQLTIDTVSNLLSEERTISKTVTE